MKRGPKPKPKPAEVPRKPMRRGPKPKLRPDGQPSERLKKLKQNKRKCYRGKPLKMTRKNYSRPGAAKENLHKAVIEYKLLCQEPEATINTKLVAALSDKYNIPRKIIRSRISRGFAAFVGQGPATELSIDEELSLQHWCQMRFLNNCPVTKEVLQVEARRISRNRLKATDSWYKGFEARHPELDFNIKPEQFTTKRKVAKTERAARQHFNESSAAIKLAESLNGGPLEAYQEANLDEKPVKSMDQMPKRVIGMSKVEKDCHFQALGDGNSFTTVEVIFADGTCLPTIYLLRGKKWPANYNIQDLDPDSVAFLTPEGGMNQEVWDEKVAPWLLSAWPKKPGKWYILRMDGLRCHLHGSTTLENFWDSKILCFQERAASSEALQALDVSCYGPLSSRIRAEASHYTVRFGVEKISQFEWPCIYKIAKSVALTPSNIKAGFEATGVWPRMTADEWLEKYGRKRGYTMIKPGKISDMRTFALKPSRLYEALDIASLTPKKRIAPTPLPAPRKKRKLAPKTTLDGLPLAAAKILNDPTRISQLRQAE